MAMTPHLRSAARVRWCGLLFACASLAVVTPAPVGAADLGIRAGQEELLAEMVGRGATLPGDCRFTGGSVNDASFNDAVVIADYVCGGRAVTLELRHPDAVPDSVLRTRQFAIVPTRGAPPPGLLESVAELIRAHEASFEWTIFDGPPDAGIAPATLLGGAWGVVGLTLALQYLIVRRRAGVKREMARGMIAGGATGLSREFTAAGWVALGVLVVAYLATRLWSLSCLPVFIDEAFHIDWARDGLGMHLIPQVSVGKWLPIQVMASFMHLPAAPLVGARLASVAMGLATLLACVCVNRELFSAREGVLAGVMYAVLPFALFYDRLAVADIYVTAAGAWLVYCSLAMIRRGGVVASVALTLCAAAAIFSKPTGAVLLAVPLLADVLLVQRDGRVAYLRAVLPTVIGGVALVAVLLAGGYGTGLVLSQSGFDPTQQLSTVRDNSARVADWLEVLLTPAIAWGALAAIVWSLVSMTRGRRGEIFLISLLLLTIGPYLVVARKFEARYLLFVTVPVSLLLGRLVGTCAAAAGRLAERRRRSIGTLARGLVTGGLVALLARDAVPLDVDMVTAPERARLPESERWQYVTSWFSGYGIPELATFLRVRAREAPINVIRLKSEPADVALNAYLTAADAIRLYTIDASDRAAAEQIAERTKFERTFFVSNRDEEPLQATVRAHYVDGAERVWSYTRPDSLSALEVWELPLRVAH